MSESLISTARLDLRPVTEDDAASMLSVWNDAAFKRNVADRGIRTQEQACEAIRNGALKLYADYGYGPYVMFLKSSGEFVGICGLFKRDNLDDADIGFAILPGFVGQGLAGEAAMAVVDYAERVLALPRLTAIVSPGNKPSIGLIKKLGMRYERSLKMPGDKDAVRLYSMSLKNN